MNTDTALHHPQSRRTLLQTLIEVEQIVLRFGLALILFWIGAMKFTFYEANAILPFEANSILFRPLLHLLGTQGLSNLLGVAEVTTALLLAIDRFSPVAGLTGSVFAMATFLTTLTFLFTTPAWESSLGGFPAISAGVGQFLLKDVVLLGASVYTARESLMRLHTVKAS